ncbi:MAG TPA: SUMF1/EgtB/PvdO family nonheme iron enzyme [Tepidisphaeraceae bacterium]|nr:SUMF1/EgtB/PvdO family nonheme iron enzyme [Tepidisphaeraceae bacterium]
MKSVSWMIRSAIGSVVLGLGVMAGAEEAPKTLPPPPAGVEVTKVKVPLCTTDTEFLKVPAGKVTIKDADGKEQTAEVKPVWISRTEITWDVYEIYYMAKDLPKAEADKQIDAKTRPSKPYENPDRTWGRYGWPAGSVHQIEALRFCDWMGTQVPGKKFRLPTEAEWEYMARAGGAPSKLSAKELEEVAWYTNNSDEKTHAVANKKPNGWGFFDVFGNVAEWVTRADGAAVVAGGSFQDEADAVGSAAREEFSKNWQKRDPQVPKSKSWLSDGGHIGIRLVMEDK